MPSVVFNDIIGSINGRARALAAPSFHQHPAHRPSVRANLFRLHSAFGLVLRPDLVVSGPATSQRTIAACSSSVLLPVRRSEEPLGGSMERTLVLVRLNAGARRRRLITSSCTTVRVFW